MYTGVDSDQNFSLERKTPLLCAKEHLYYNKYVIEQILEVDHMTWTKCDLQYTADIRQYMGITLILQLAKDLLTVNTSCLYCVPTKRRITSNTDVNRQH